MGTWGTAIFSDDLAADVRDQFTDLIAEGLTSPAATKRLVAEFREAIDDPDDGVVFWLALAAVQRKLGRLAPAVQKKALRIIDTNADLTRWSENAKSEIEQRKKHLAKLRQELTAQQPEPKKLRKRTKSSTKFKAGDVVAYQLTSRTTVRLCVMGLCSDLGGTYADICLLGFDDGQPFQRDRLALKDTLGPHFTLVSREPDEGIKILRRRVALPERNSETLGAWCQLKVHGYACSWNEFPQAIRKALRQLKWKRP